jgi:hypothetical protein
MPGFGIHRPPTYHPIRTLSYLHRATVVYITCSILCNWSSTWRIFGIRHVRACIYFSAAQYLRYSVIRCFIDVYDRVGVEARIHKDEIDKTSYVPKLLKCLDLDLRQ